MFGFPSANKRVLVSGIQATGSLHFGNYFGAMKQNIDLANGSESLNPISSLPIIMHSQQ
jgi:tryptophanyl-tRNA synthetase